MVTRYDVISSSWSSHLIENVCFFNFFRNKSKVCGKMMQSNYVLFYMLRAKILIPSVFTRFLILDKIQDGDHVC